MSESMLIKEQPVDVTQGVIEVLVEALKVQSEDVNLDTQLVEGGLSLGSLQLIEVIVALEEKFELVLIDELLDIENFLTVATLSRTVEKAANAS